MPGTGGVRLSWEARPSRGQPPTLLRTYYDNGTLDFVSVRCDSGSHGAILAFLIPCVQRDRFAFV